MRTSEVGDGLLVIALCLLEGLLSLFVFVLQVVLKFLRSVQVLHALRSNALLCFVTVGLIWAANGKIRLERWRRAPQHRYTKSLHLMACRKYSTACWYKRRASSQFFALSSSVALVTRSMAFWRTCKVKGQITNTHIAGEATKRQQQFFTN